MVMWSGERAKTGTQDSSSEGVCRVAGNGNGKVRSGLEEGNQETLLEKPRGRLQLLKCLMQKDQMCQENLI